jgi:hypothetical protein
MKKWLKVVRGFMHCLFFGPESEDSGQQMREDAKGNRHLNYL